MYCVIQFYYQLRHDLKPFSVFLKVIAIKLVIFLSFWQTFLISILTSASINLVKPTAHIAYPDLIVGVPSLLLCIEMAFFAVLHLFAFPYSPYTKSSRPSKYPLSEGEEIGPNQGGFLGIMAFADAMNPWDLVTGFGRGMRWLFVGRKHRQEDPSYKANSMNSNTGSEIDVSMDGNKTGYNRPHLPIANEFRQSKFGMPNKGPADEEGAGLIAHAQPSPFVGGSGYVPAKQRYDRNGQDLAPGEAGYGSPPYESSPDRLIGMNPTPGSLRRQQEAPQEQIGMALS
jgi:hypothetical protein